jgi:hypothetical protein
MQGGQGPVGIFVARSHDCQHPAIASTIWDAILMDSYISYEALSRKIGYWCCAETVRKYVTAQEGFEYYKKHIKPGISAVNAVKQRDFALRVQRRWDLPRGKYLWIHYDEKW